MGGKASLCQDWGVTHIFDDQADVLQENLEKGITIWPVCTPYERHTWHDGAVYQTFADAADAFLVAMRQQALDNP